MLVGVPKEIKNHEYRVGLTPAAVHELCKAGHKVMVQNDAGTSIGLDNAEYQKAGAEMVAAPAEIFKRADMIVKVKEPQANECVMLREDQILFTYLHLAPDPEQAAALMKSGAHAIAYETVTDERNRLPLLAPMSEVAGRMSIQAGAHYLEKTYGGRGVLLSGVPGVMAGNVVVLGGGVVGTNAAKVAIGMGAHVTVIERSNERMKELDMFFGASINTVYATDYAIEKYALEADLVIGAVLVPGASAPRLITREMIGQMKKGSVLVDVSIDQGGCFETSKATTHADPVYTVDGVIHYCVANMPGAVARTSTFALNNATLPYVLALAEKGYKKALLENPGFRKGLNVSKGKITHKEVAEALNQNYQAAEDALAA
ncbi:MAG: alanine dehydrogenase [Alphaproteobacteria bacterium]|nr:alanine dehydrogenase [Alphaproteobacteria bacterium]